MADDVANPVEQDWVAELIPDGDLLYMRVPRQFFNEDGTVQVGAFRDHGGGMSTDWMKYARPEETQSRTGKPHAYGVISLLVGGVRQIPEQSVVHTPDRENNNRAHTDVFGEKKKDPEVRILFRRLYNLVIPLPNPEQ